MGSNMWLQIGSLASECDCAIVVRKDEWRSRLCSICVAKSKSIYTKEIYLRGKRYVARRSVGNHALVI